MNPDAIVVKKPVGIVMGIPADGRHSPGCDILFGLDKLAKPLWIHELPFTKVMEGGDLVFERKLRPFDGLFGRSKAAV